ncbi:SAM-dependent methyltransferase [Halorubrum sp. HHNYT27]|uniref:SAM-dependent methyltransferase n=1 Tax=Halorubrum sp. HHNYT27 TaxID=3402275 RepID=UPI003EBA707E
MSVPTSIAKRPITHVYDAAYAGVPNWDIGRPQRAFVQLLDAGLVRSPVLDIGCGTGELSLFLARHAEDDIYGITPAEIRDRFRVADGCEMVFAYSTTFERRWSSNAAYFVGVRRL